MSHSKDIPLLKQSTVTKHEIKGELVNYSAIQKAKFNPVEKVYTLELTESKMQLILKALNIAYHETRILVESRAPYFTQEQTVERFKQASDFNDLSKELQNL